MNTQEVKKLQQLLNDSGYGPLKVDGIYGKNTADAYQQMMHDSSLGGTNNDMPVPAPVKGWWMHPALISGLATIIATALQFTGAPVESSTIESLMTSLFGVVTGGMAIYAAFKNSSTVDKTLVAPGFRFSISRLRGIKVSTNGVSKAPTSDRVVDRGPFFPD